MMILVEEDAEGEENKENGRVRDKPRNSFLQQFPVFESSVNYVRLNDALGHKSILC